MGAKYIRPKKDGSGFSECSCPDELVGKGRCCHILGDSGSSTLEIEQIQRGLYEVKVHDSKIEINAEKEAIIDFFNSLPKIDQEKQNKIITFLMEE